jgi:hypothetical protein
MLRIARILSVTLLCTLLLAMLPGLRAGELHLGVPTHLFMLSMAFSVGALYMTPPTWFRWIAILINAVWACIGLLLAIATLLSLMGIKHFAGQRPLLVFGLASMVLVLPCVSNIYALFKRHRQVGPVVGAA